MKRLVIDLDGTLSVDEPDKLYAGREPNGAVDAKLREYRTQGYEIITHSARNMRTYQNQMGLINVHTLPIILDWLRQHDIPFDEVHVEKPWCGVDGFYIDDRAIRPDEFISMTVEQVHSLLDNGGKQKALENETQKGKP